MKLRSLSLQQFRSWEDFKLDLEPEINLIIGKNGTGKTNLLEAICLLSTGESFRASKIEEMVHFGAEMGRVKGVTDAGEELQVMVTRGSVAGRKVAKRRFLIEEVSRRKADFVGLLPTVIFRPEDLILLDGSPSDRRRFVDQALSQVDTEYGRSLQAYEQALRRRNRLLSAIQEGLATRYALTFWDGLIIKHGEILQEKRTQMFQFINDLWSRSQLFGHLQVVYDKSLISQSRLEQYKEEEVAAGYTLVGPHKDDFLIMSKENQITNDEGRDLGIYGSRGEQRMAVLALKVGELYFIEENKQTKPILLLDDIFSELDEVHAQEVRRVCQDRQVIVTTALAVDAKLLPEAHQILIDK